MLELLTLFAIVFGVNLLPAFGPASGGGHQHDRIIGKMAQAHVNSELSSPI